MKAILSDIHGNLEALQAVLEDIDRLEVEALYCLGDVVGYGPDPRACLDLVMQRCRVVLRGNHEQAVLGQPGNLTPIALQAALWTRSQLAAPVPDRPAAVRRWEFLQGLRPSHREGDLLFVHGSPRDPVNEYIRPEWQGEVPIMLDLFSRVGRCCFSGHTHWPGVFTAAFEFLSPKRLAPAYRLGAWKALCNVGSVGQPRDGDWRACYALFDGEAIRFRRVRYDVEGTVRKIRATEGLDQVLGERLLRGQ